MVYLVCEGKVMTHQQPKFMRIASIRQLASFGMNVVEIAQRLGLKKDTVRVYAALGGINVTGTTRAKTGVVRLYPPEMITEMYSRQAMARGYRSAQSLMVKVLKIVADDNLFNAVLEDSETNPTQSGRINEKETVDG